MVIKFYKQQNAKICTQNKEIDHAHHTVMKVSGSWWDRHINIFLI